MKGKSRRTEKVEAYLQTEEGLNDIAQRIEAGHSMEQVAQGYGISRMTLHRWTKKYRELEEVMDAAREKQLDAIENSLYDLCFERPYTTVTSTYDRDGRLLRWTTTEGTRVQSLKAIIFILCNLRPDEWKPLSKLKESSPKECYDRVPKVVIPTARRTGGEPTEAE